MQRLHTWNSWVDRLSLKEDRTKYALGGHKVFFSFKCARQYEPTVYMQMNVLAVILTPYTIESCKIKIMNSVFNSSIIGDIKIA